MTFTPGDFILTRAHTPLSWLIRFGQSLKINRRYARWSHTALVISSNGMLVEAHASGIKIAHIKEYEREGTSYIHVPTEMNEHDRQQVISFAYSKVGQRYGYLTFCALILNLITPQRFVFTIDNSEICSTLVARCLERAGYVFPHSPSAMVPADLAQYFKVGDSA